MAKPPMLGDLVQVFTLTGLNEQMKGFVQIRAEGEIDGAKVALVGQIDPDTCRGLAAQYMEVANGAEQDALLGQVLGELDLPEEATYAILRRMRELREEGRDDS